MARYWPLGTGRIVTSPFGPRDGGFHAGTDFGFLGGSANKPFTPAPVAPSSTREQRRATAGRTLLAGWLLTTPPRLAGGAPNTATSSERLPVATT